MALSVRSRSYEWYCVNALSVWFRLRFLAIGDALGKIGFPIFGHPRHLV